MIEDHKDSLRKIKLIISDVDGVMTDGGIILGSDGAEFKRFNVQDGMGVTMVRRAGIKFCIITGRTSESVSRRAEELRADEVYQGILDKTIPYEEIKTRYDLRDDEIMHLGDDVLDIPLLERVGFAVAPANARPQVKEYADYVTVARGGEGALREIIDILLEAQDKMQEIVDYYASTSEKEVVG